MQAMRILRINIYIKKYIIVRSLIIIDELGRGTGVDEGSAVCWAVCEELLKGGSYTFLATHFQLIPLLANIYPAVVNYHFLLDRDQEQEVHFTHVLGTVYSCTRYSLLMY